MPPLAYLRTDTIDDAVSSFELALMFYERAQEDDRFWKWFVTAAHSGVQGTFALALQGTDGLQVQKPGVAKQTLAAFEAQATPPAPHMDNFQRLHRKLWQAGTLRPQANHPLPDCAAQEEAVAGLDELRDEFLHFNTKSWSVEKSLIELRARVCARVARFLLLESDAVRIYEPIDRERAHTAISHLAERLRVDA